MLDSEEQAHLQEIRHAIGVLEGALERFVTKIGPPIFIAEDGGGRFKYASPSSLILQVLKAVRIVSGLNALTVLLRAGYTTEMAVIIRTIDDFIGEIFFMHEAHETGKPTVDQQHFVELFFAEEDVSVLEMLKSNEPGPDRVKRRKIQASEARLLGKENPDRVRRMARTIDDVYSKYTHGAYPTIMELYVGGDREGFHVRGTHGSPRIAEFRRELAHYVHRALNTFAHIAGALQLLDLREGLLDARRHLEQSSAYRS